MCKKKDEATLVWEIWYYNGTLWPSDGNSVIFVRPAELCKPFELWQLLGDGGWSEMVTIEAQGDSCCSLDLAFWYLSEEVEAHLARVEGLGEVDNLTYPLNAWSSFRPS